MSGTPGPVALRLARPADRAAAVALWTALHREHEAFDARYRLTDDAADRWGRDFREWTQSRQDAVWLAETTWGEPQVGVSQAVGLLTAHLYEPVPTFRPHRMVYVDDLYVAPAARGAGVARQLLEAAQAWGRAHDAIEVRAGVLASNPAGRAFWASAGAADYAVTVTLPL